MAAGARKMPESENTADSHDTILEAKLDEGLRRLVEKKYDRCGSHEVTHRQLKLRESRTYATLALLQQTRLTYRTRLF